MADLTALQWLSGSWGGAHDGACLEEHWTAVAGGTLMAISRMVAEGKTVHQEFLLLEQAGSDVHLTILLPQNLAAEKAGRSLLRFRLTEVETRRAVFDSTFEPPERIIYREDPPGTLVARLEKMRDGKPWSVDFRMQRLSSPRLHPQSSSESSPG